MIGAIVLAAGASSRMGRPKAWLTVGPDGPTFVDAIAATLLAAGVAATRVVVARELAPRRATFVVNPDPAAGMLSSVQCGLNALGRDLEAVLVWPVDHPLVRPETIVAMIEALRSARAPVVVPTHNRLRGHPALFAAGVFPELLSADPACGARAVVHAHGDRIELEVADPGVREDIDTPADYARLCGRRVAYRTAAP